MIAMLFAFIGAAVTHFMLGDDAGAMRAFLSVALGIVVGVTAAIIGTFFIFGNWDVGPFPFIAAALGPIVVWRIHRDPPARTMSKSDLRNR